MHIFRKTNHFFINFEAQLKNIHKSLLMKQEEEKFESLPDNAFRELESGEEYQPLMSPKRISRSYYLVRSLGTCNGCTLFCSRRLPWFKSRTGF